MRVAHLLLALIDSYLEDKMAVKLYGEAASPSAILIPSDHAVDGIEFYSPQNFPQQLGAMTRPKGYIVKAHVHNIIDRNISITQEVLILRSGHLRVRLFDVNLNEDAVFEMHPGDVLLLASGGHEITMLEESVLVEVKQGPYLGVDDKTHFEVNL